MTLMEAFREHLVTGHQGQLVIKFTGDVHLCKILVDNGQAVHISHGRLAPELILKSLTGKVVEWANFIAGYPVRKRVDFPLHQSLLAAVSQEPATVVQQPVVQAPPLEQAAPPVVQEGPTLAAEKVTAVVEGFIDLVGPLGTILAERAAAAISHTLGDPMPESSFNVFVQALAKEVTDEDRSRFIESYTR